ncbi:unnamed protein product, partial [Laminaria digitata]
MNGAATGQGHRTVARGFTRETFAAEHARLVMRGQRSPSVGRSARTRTGTAAPRQATGKNDRGKNGAGVGANRHPRTRRAAVQGSREPAAAAAATSTARATAAATAGLSSSSASRRRQQQGGPLLGARGTHPTPTRRVAGAR